MIKNNKSKPKKSLAKQSRGAIITSKILETLSEMALDSTALFGAIITAGYGASPSQIERRQGEIRYKLENWNAQEQSWDYIKRSRHSFDSLLSKLKSDGLIKKDDNGKLRITKHGKNKLTAYSGALPTNTYVKEEDGVVKIFMFDIPEDYRYKRIWLRHKLIVDLGFTPIQKSVLIGKSKLPTEFMEDLRRIGLIDHVDVLAVTKTGSVKELI